MVRRMSEPDSTYEPYTGVTIPISWQSEAGTVYGGTLDVTMGILTVDRAKFTVDGTAGYMDNTRFVVLYPDVARLYAETQFTRNDAICDRLKSETWARLSQVTSGIAPAWSGGVGLKLSGISTVEEYKNHFSNNNLEVFLKVQPQTYQLTPTEVKMLLGENNVWADTGDSN